MGKTIKILPYTVGELIAELEKFPKYLNVYYWNQAGKFPFQKGPDSINTIMRVKDADGENDHVSINVY